MPGWKPLLGLEKQWLCLMAASAALPSFMELCDGAAAETGVGPCTAANT